MSKERKAAAIRVRLSACLVGLSLILAACEDEGNPGNDNLLTGGSVVVIVIIVVVIYPLRAATAWMSQGKTE